MTWPSCNTTTMSALRMVERRCAMMMVVRPTATMSRASWTTRSDSESRALVASSRRSIFGAFMTALAMVELLFPQPESHTHGGIFPTD